MLGSITWLGESGRNARWWVTVGWFGVGAVGAGALVGWLMGLLGAAYPARPGRARRTRRWRCWPLPGLQPTSGWAACGCPPCAARSTTAGSTGTAAGCTASASGSSSGWAWSRSSPPSAVYLAFAAAALSGSPAAGALIGAVFGAVRWLSVLPGGWVRRSADLVRMDGRLRRWEPAGRRVTLGGEVAAVILLAVVAGAA